MRYSPGCSSQGDCKDVAVINHKSSAQGELAGGKELARVIGTWTYLLSWTSVKRQEGYQGLGGCSVILLGA